MTELSRVPGLATYAAVDLAKAAEWPAIRRCLNMLERAPLDDASRLRLTRHRAWVEAAIATCLTTADAESICAFWSSAVDELIESAWSLSGAKASSAAALALGKLGARELNLSSDVDLIYLRADGAVPPLKELREFQRLLSDPTEFGFCCRVDVSIRPGGSAAPLCPSLSEFENHYGSMGEMWERLALIRLRPVAGDAVLGAEAMAFARKFSFRKHLDYTLLDDLRELRSRIRLERPSRPQTRGSNYFHLKLGAGGIRETELFTHALQAMHGGRRPELQTGSTSTAISTLKTLSILPEADVDGLATAYWTFRELENRLQGYDDQQTYWIDLAHGSPAAPGHDLRSIEALATRAVQLADSLLGKDVEDQATEALVADAPVRLRSLGFSDASIAEAWPKLLQATALSRRSQKDETERMRFLAAFVERLSTVGLDQDLGLALLVDFAKATRAKASFFALLNREPRLIDDLARLFSTSPYLGGLLCARPELIDSFLHRAQSEAPADMELLLDDLGERRLLSELIAANRFLANRDLASLVTNLSDNADSIAQLLLARMVEERGDAGVSILALGKWGGRELGLRSDLDFVFACEREPDEAAQKFAKRFLSRLSSPRPGGSIYAVDMRLRPSGAAGPMIVSWASLRDYLENHAAAWERQAYLRARPLGVSPFDASAVSAAHGLLDQEREELRDIRARLLVEGESLDVLDLKLGRGGLAAIEFAAQIASLDARRASLDPSTRGMIQYLMRGDANWSAMGEELIEVYERIRVVEQMHQLTTSQAGSKLRIKSDGFFRLARVMGEESGACERGLRALMERAAEILAKIDPLSY